MYCRHVRTPAPANWPATLREEIEKPSGGEAGEKQTDEGMKRDRERKMKEGMKDGITKGGRMENKDKV